MINSKLVFATKALDENNKYNIEAIATTFGNSDNVGDIIKEGALDDYIKEFNAGNTEPLRMLRMHDRADIIGEWTNIVIEDKKVLIKGNMLTETQSGKDTMTLVKKGLLSGISVGFRSSDYTVNDDTFSRTYNKIELVETSVVDTPANKNAVVLDTKNYKGEFDLKVIERCLRDVGLSVKQAKSFISRGKSGLSSQRDVDEQDKALELLKSFKI